MNKYARKSLQTNIPKNITTGKVDYKSIPAKGILDAKEIRQERKDRKGEKELADRMIENFESGLIRYST